MCQCGISIVDKNDDITGKADTYLINIVHARCTNNVKKLNGDTCVHCSSKNAKLMLYGVQYHGNRCTVHKKILVRRVSEVIVNFRQLR